MSCPSPNPPSRRLVRFLVSAVALWFAGVAHGGTNYLVRSWDFETGVAVSALNCLCLTRDGFLWLGAKDGLIRFDGVQFIRVTTPEPTLIQGNSITALWADDQGRLWLGCESGDVFCWDQLHATVVALPQKWQAQPIRSIAGDGHGDVWLALATHDLVRVRDGWTLHAAATAPMAGTVQHLLRTSDGRLYEQSGTTIRLQGGTRDAPSWQELQVPGTVIQRIAPSHRGGQWIFADDVLRRWTGTAWGEERGRLPPGTYINRMLEASNGDLFVGTLYRGMLVYRRDGTVQHIEDPTTGGERIVDLTEDREGNILACSDRRLLRIRPNRVEVVRSEEKWGGRQPVSVTCASDGSWWVGTEGAGLFHVRPDGIRRLTSASGLQSPFVWSLLAEKDGGLWVGTWGGGLFRRAGDHFTQAGNWDLPVQGWTVSALLRDRAGVLWVGSNTGVWRQDGAGWSAIREDDGTAVMLVRGLEEDAVGRVWMGTSGHGLKWWANGHVHTVSARDGLPARFIAALHGDGSGVLWVGTVGMGLYRYAGGKWTHLDHTGGLPSDEIFSIAEDPHGKFWFTSAIGVFSVSRTELDDLATGQLPQVHPLILDREDGLPSNNCSRGTQSAASMTADGLFLVPTALGLAAVPTGSIDPRTDKVTVSITSASFDDRPVVPSADHAIRAPAGTRRVAIEFTAPSFSNPERIHFRYQLRGLDDRWVDLGTRRNVLFSHLPPGDYELRIMASNSDQVWNPIPATLAVTIDPHFWEAEWFRISAVMLLILCVGLTVWWIVHQRIQRRVEQLEAQQVIEQERRRIAGDIHDQLGASLTQIMMMSQAGTPSPDTMPRIHSVACDITKSMDELVWAVNPSHDTLESFAAYGVRIAQELVSDAGLRLRLNIPDQLPDIKVGAGIRHHLLLLLKEAINNVVRHAKATEVTVTLAVEHGRLRLDVNDNGQGFDPAEEAKDGRGVRRGGHGLPNLRRRAQEMGGTLEIISAPQRGTTLRLLVPLPSLHFA